MNALRFVPKLPVVLACKYLIDGIDMVLAALYADADPIESEHGPDCSDDVPDRPISVFAVCERRLGVTLTAGDAQAQDDAQTACLADPDYVGGARVPGPLARMAWDRLEADSRR